MFTRLLIVIALILALALVGCSGGESSTESTSETSEEAAPASAVIVLEEGWAIQDVITPEEVGDIMGANLVYFPEGASASQDGKPKAGYTQEGVEYSKVFFGVDVEGGEEEYEIIKGYAVEGSAQDIAGLGDQATTIEYDDGRVGVLVLEGEAFIRIDWPGDVYGTGAEQLGTQLAELLMGKMYGE